MLTTFNILVTVSTFSKTIQRVSFLFVTRILLKPIHTGGVDVLVRTISRRSTAPVNSYSLNVVRSMTVRPQRP